MSVTFRGATVRGERAETRAWRGYRLRSASAEPMASDEARRRGFGDDRRGRSRHEMPKRVKSDETAGRTMLIMPSAALVWAASGTQHFQMRRFAQDSMARLI